MLSSPDIVYLRFKRKIDAKVGDRYMVFHTDSESEAPGHQQAAGLPHRLAWAP